jgi:MoaA/NifB/PqqE/SkfB family radical SAM enzyme
MDILDGFKKTYYQYKIFLRPLPPLRQARILYRKFTNRFICRNTVNTLVFGLTYRCQLNCVHCGVNANADSTEGELDTDEIKETLRQARGLGVYFVVLFGGEPFLRRDILEIVQYAAKLGMMVSISTNGLLLDRRLLEKLKKCGVSFLNISLDSSDHRVHDRLRRCEGSFQKAMHSLEEGVAAGVNVIVSTYATKENIQSRDIERIIVLAKAKRASGVRILLAIPAGRLSNAPGLEFSEQDKAYIYKLLDPTYVFIEGVCNARTECNALLKRLFYISPYGQVQPCGFVPASYGDIRTDRLSTIWARMKSSRIYAVLDHNDCIMRHSDIQDGNNEIFRGGAVLGCYGFRK